MINEFIFNCKKWKNIEYDFNKNSKGNNCTLNIYASNKVSVN